MKEQPNATPPFGLDFWSEFLVGKRLPVDGETHRQLKRRLGDRYVMLNELAPLIHADPLLTLQVTRTAGRLHSHKGSEVTGVSHALSSLGLDHLEDICQRAPAFQLGRGSVAHKEFLTEVSLSFHAAALAGELQRSRTKLFIDEVQLSALFHNIGRWMLWLFAPRHMGEIRRLQQQDPKLTDNDAQLKVLGCTIDQISYQLIGDWNLPELAATSLNPKNLPEPSLLRSLHLRALDDPRLPPDQLRALNHLVQEKFFPVQLANWLALSSRNGWRGQRTLQLVDVINDYLKGELDLTNQMLHQLWADTSRRYHPPGAMAPAAQMLLLPSNPPALELPSEAELRRLFPKSPPLWQPEPEEKPKPEPAPAQVQVKPDPVLFKQAIETLLKSQQPLETRKVFVNAVKALHNGIGFQRVALMILQPQRAMLKTVMTAGVKQDESLGGFECSTEDQLLLAKLCEKPVALQLTPETTARYLSKLPPNYKANVPTSGCLMMALFSGRRAVAILHADMGESGPSLTSAHLDRFRYVCTAASKALQASQPAR